MRLYIACAAFITPILMLLSTPVKSLELDLSLPTKSALNTFTDSDWALLKTSAKTALNYHPDGNTLQWLNNETGHSGKVTPLSTSTANDRVCRNTEFVNIAGDNSSITRVNLCNQGGKWFEEGARKTTNVELGEASAHSESFMHNGTQAEEPVISRKVLSQTSERCVTLAQNIEKLRGKPMRHSAAIELHKAECRH